MEKDGSSKEIKPDVSVQPNAGLKETIDALGNRNRLKLQYTVGKKSETKSIQVK